jgi:Acyl-CoA thioesterase C-terminal domain/Acyl-CoA thioesterase N-terminal domain
VSALLARAVEGVPSPVPVQVVRVTIELIRPVPLVPLSVSASLVRPGKRVQLVEAALLAEGTEVARARGLRIRIKELAGMPLDIAAPPAPPPSGSVDPDGLPATARRTAFAQAVDMRFVTGGWDEVGPATMWTRLVVPVVDDEPPTPLQRTVAAADFGNGVSRVLGFETHTFINPDLTVSLARVPAGEWIGMEAVSRVSAEGYGQAESRIFDAAGPVGRAVQSLIVEER